MKNSIIVVAIIGLSLLPQYLTAQELMLQQINGSKSFVLYSGDGVTLKTNDGLSTYGKLMFLNDSVYVISRNSLFFDQSIIQEVHESGISIDNRTYTKNELRIVHDTMLLPVENLYAVADIEMIRSDRIPKNRKIGGIVLCTAIPLVTLAVAGIVSLSAAVVMVATPAAGIIAFMAIPEIFTGITLLSSGKSFKKDKWNFELK